MLKQTMNKVGIAVAALAMLAACGGDGYPEAELDITVEHPDTETLAYTVSCGGDDASVEGADLDPDEACEVLANPEAVSRLVEGPPQNRICTEIYGGPDVATINGTMDGQAVGTTVDRTNGCGISEWDDLLAGLLPPALGATG